MLKTIFVSLTIDTCVKNAKLVNTKVLLLA